MGAKHPNLYLPRPGCYRERTEIGPPAGHHGGTVALSGAPDRAQEDPNGASKTPLGHRGDRQNSAKEKPRDTEHKMQRTRKGQQTHTPNLIAIYEGFVRMTFGEIFGETPRHEQNTNT